MKKWIFILVLSVICVLNAAGQQVIPDIIEVCTANGFQGFPQTCYNWDEDEFLVVWEDERNEPSTGTDIWGQIVRSDGTLRGSNFGICRMPGDQYWPRCDYDPINHRYLVVFEDYRNGGQTWDWFGNWDIYGAQLNTDGRKIVVAGSEADSCFGISKNAAAAHYPSVAFNWRFGVYQVVWADYRNTTIDIYGQRVAGNGALLAKSGTPVLDGNFPIANHSDADEDTPDISYSHINNDFW